MSNQHFIDQLPEGEGPPPDIHQLEFHGNAQDYFRIWIVNFLLTVVTLGIWRFWGVTRERRYVWSNTTLDGDPLEWTGTGKELAIGFLLAALTIIIPGVVLYQVGAYLLGQGNIWGAVMMGFVILSAYFLGPVAAYRAAKYRMSRTAWRGIRGGQSENGFGFAGKALLYMLLSIVTLGFAAPWVDAGLWRYQMQRRSFGNYRFNSDVKGGDLFGPYMISIFLFSGLMVVFTVLAAILGLLVNTLMGAGIAGEVISGILFIIVIFVMYGLMGVSAAYYLAARLRLMVEKTGFGPTSYQNSVSFRFDVSTKEIVKLVATNILLLIVTIGFAYPWTMVRYLRFIAKHLEIKGEMDLTELRQSERPEPRFGEGMADALGAGGVI